MFSSTLRLAVLLAVAASARAAIYDDPSQLPDSASYGFIVVGAGTAGNVIAARLAETQNASVLVIDSGRR